MAMINSSRFAFLIILIALSVEVFGEYIDDVEVVDYHEDDVEFGGINEAEDDLIVPLADDIHDEVTTVSSTSKPITPPPLQSKDIFAPCNGDTICFGDTNGCVERKDCGLMVTVEKQTDGNQTKYEIIGNIREAMDEVPSKKTVYMWFSEIARPARDRDDFIQSKVVYSEFYSKTVGILTFIWYDCRDYLLIKDTSGTNLTKGHVERYSLEGDDKITYHQFQYKYGELVEYEDYVFEGDADNYIHAVINDEKRRTKRVIRTDGAYNLAKLGEAKLPVQVKVFEFNLRNMNKTLPGSCEDKTQPPEPTDAPTTPVGSVTPANKKKMRAYIIILIIIIVLSLLFIIYFAYVRFTTHSPESVDGGIVVAQPEEDSNIASTPIVVARQTPIQTPVTDNTKIERTRSNDKLDLDI